MISKDTFEAHLKGILESTSSGHALWAKYKLAYEKLQAEVLSWIPKKEGELSDHGHLHIDNVLENSARLLDLDPAYPGCGSKAFNEADLSPVEAYVLGMALLFHDSGNIAGRRGHAEKGKEVIATITKGLLDPSEIRVIGRIMAAHSSGPDGPPDTIGALPEYDYVARESVQTRRLAAIVRFADELAEGPQRTSNYLRSKGEFILEGATGACKRNPFHDYASITTVNIDPGGGRVALVYHLDLDDPMFKDATCGERAWLRMLLRLMLKRIRKTDDERRYAKYYAGRLLQAYRSTEVSIHFHRGGVMLDGIGLKFEINDLVVPREHGTHEDDQKWIAHHSREFDIETLLAKAWA